VKEIHIKCQGADALPIDTLVDFQGKLKKLSKKNAEKLSKALEKEFIDPIKVWQDGGFNKVIDGQRRLIILYSLRESGWNIPLIPVDYCFPKDKKQAREWVLRYNTRYGEFVDEELDVWLKEIDESDRETLRLVDEEIKIKDISIDDLTEQKNNKEYENMICPKCGFEWQK
jgi:hypothetical protein